MKANELMIGDWVKTTSDWPERYQNKITRVRGLCDENGQIDCDLTEPNGAYVWSDDEDSFEPIPLTAEILEKNGLRKVTLDGEKGSKQDYYIDTHFVGYYNMDALTRVHASPIVYDIKQKWLFVDDKQICRIELMCPYVHTLQHALRLCGIDKEIVL